MQETRLTFYFIELQITKHFNREIGQISETKKIMEPFIEFSNTLSSRIVTQVSHFLFLGTGIVGNTFGHPESTKTYF